MNVFPLDIKREAAAIHALMMLQCRQTNALREPRDIVEDLRTIHSVLNIPLVVLTLEAVDILLKEALVELRLADIVQESSKDNVLCRFMVKLHPLRNNTRENRNAQGVIVNIACQMIDLVQIVNRAAAARERQQITLNHLIGLGNGNRTRFLRLLKDGFRRSNHIFILFDEQIAAREDRRPILLQFRLILNVDNGNLQKLESRDMRCRQLSILGYNNNAFRVCDRSRKYHSTFKIAHGYCTQDKPSLD